jgi:hypothetical protein
MLDMFSYSDQPNLIGLISHSSHPAQIFGLIVEERET